MIDLRRAIHAGLWQRLPRSWRRAALVGATQALAPRPGRSAKPALPVVVAGFLTTNSGLGESARLCLAALRSQGVPVFGVDIGAGLMQPTGEVSFPYEDGLACVGAGLLIVHVNAPFMPLALTRLGRNLVRDKFVVGYWHWELPRVPEDWRAGVPFVHEAWVPSRFTAEAVAAVLPPERIRILPHPVAVGVPDRVGSPRPPRTPGDPFTVLTMFNMGSSMARKNPLGSIEAFRRAFGSSTRVRLIVKAGNLDLFPEGKRRLLEALAAVPQAELHEQPLSRDELMALIGSSDVVISLHRSEGFGLPLAEAMLLGVPVVGTDFSGSADFVTAEVGYPVPVRLVPALDPQGTYDDASQSWAEPDLEAAADALRALEADPRDAAERGRRAAAVARDLFGPRHYCSIALKDLPTSHATASASSRTGIDGF